MKHCGQWIEAYGKKRGRLNNLILKKGEDILDSLNVGKLEQGNRSRNENLKPNISEDDPRFEFEVDKRFFLGLYIAC